MLSVERLLKAHAAATPDAQAHAWSYEGRPFPTGGRRTTEAAVLVPLCELLGDVCVILTLRSAKLKKHAGEVALPGGKRDADDASPVATALREAHEEVGLDPAACRVLCCLNGIVSKHMLTVTPVVAAVSPEYVYHHAKDEVSMVFAVPLREFLAESHHTSQQLSWQGVPFRMHFFRPPADVIVLPPDSNSEYAPLLAAPGRGDGGGTQPPLTAPTAMTLAEAVRKCATLASSGGSATAAVTAAAQNSHSMLTAVDAAAIGIEGIGTPEEGAGAGAGTGTAGGPDAAGAASAESAPAVAAPLVFGMTASIMIAVSQLAMGRDAAFRVTATDGTDRMDLVPSADGRVVDRSKGDAASGAGASAGAPLASQPARARL